MVVIDLFSGAGGLTEGFYSEGFNIIAHVEKDKWACETLKTRIIYHYLKKHNYIELYNEYLRKSNGYLSIDKDREFLFNMCPELAEKLELEVINKEFGNPQEEAGTSNSLQIIEMIEKSKKFNGIKQIDLIIGGPPCQAYSIVGRARMRDAVEHDKRNYLFRYYKDIVSHFKPQMFVFENVPGILTAKKGKIFEAIYDEFDKIGYSILSRSNNNIKENILNASDFGVPQNRRRLILFGFRKELNLEYPDFLANRVAFSGITTRDAIGDLPPLKIGEGNDFKLVKYNSVEKELTDYQKFIRKDSIGIINHKARVHNERDLEIYRRAIREAEKGNQLKYNQLDKKFRTHKKDDVFIDRFKVHKWDEIPHTIVAHIAKDGHYNIHPDTNQLRSLTVRESARIQSFPDNFKFEGPRTAQFTQVGNAVPPLMAQSIAQSIKTILESLGKEEELDKYINQQKDINTAK